MFTWQFGQQRVPSMNDGQHCGTILQIGQQRVLSVSMNDDQDSGIILQNGQQRVFKVDPYFEPNKNPKTVLQSQIRPQFSKTSLVLESAVF